MRLTSSMQRSRQTGFTLIELLVVISIIAVLMGLTLVAVQQVRKKGPELKAREEITQFNSAIEAFKQHFEVDYIPNSFRLKSVYAIDLRSDLFAAMSRAYLRRMFPRMKFQDIIGGSPTAINTGLPDIDLNGNQCLMFFLTGFKTAAGDFQGFSTNPEYPFRTQGGSRMGPLVEVNGKSLDASFQFVDPWGSPYVYFTAINRSYGPLPIPPSPIVPWSLNMSTATPTGVSVAPFLELVNGTPKVVNGWSYQMISAGANKRFGGGGGWVPGNGDYSNAPTVFGADDMSNFHPRLLGIP